MNQILDQILNKISKLKKSTNSNQWTGCCPAHKDKNPSFSIKLTDDGRILLHCFTGCTLSEILNSLGLEMSDLYPKNSDLLGKKPIKNILSPRDILNVISNEILKVLLIAHDMNQSKSISQDSYSSLEKSVSRILNAIDIGGLTHE